MAAWRCLWSAPIARSTTLIKVPGSSAATNWSAFSIVSSSRVNQTAKLAVGKWANGALDLFVIGTDCLLYHNYQTTVGNSTSWSGFNSLGGPERRYLGGERE